MAKVVHFEIIAGDIDRAAKFYHTVFGWKAQRWGKEPYILVEGPKKEAGINGGIMPRGGIFAKKGGFMAYLCTIQVKNIKETVKKIKKAGGKPVNKMQVIPHVGTHQYFEDTEGNVFGVLEPPPGGAM